MSRCARCGAEFICGMADCAATGSATDTPCWCMELPTLPAAALHGASGGKDAQPNAGCLCRACLLATLASSSTQEDDSLQA